MQGILNRWLWLYLAIYIALLVALVKVEGLAPEEPLFVLLVLGGLFSGLAVLVTRKYLGLAVEVRNPASELVMILLWLVPIGVYLVNGPGTVRRLVPDDPWQYFALGLAKVALFVVLPALIFRFMFGYRWRELAPGSLRWHDFHPAIWLSIAMVVFQCVFGRGLRDLREAHASLTVAIPAAVAAFVWLLLEVGVVEEFFFRVLLQERLSRVLRSRMAGIVVASLLFGMIHAPGYYFRSAATHENVGPHPTLLYAVGYSVVVTSVAGIFMGTIWARTRNFAVLIMVHAITDLVPGLLPFLRHMGLI
ncbi:MAG: CPBP family intramembrane metalloprotease [Acidobacteriales bacterium]|nr:CPBP family intramembrane metalloprotease [Terriglobales bacterium]